MSNILTSLIEKVKTEKTGKLMRKYITESLENINSRLFSCEESYKSSVVDSGKSNKEIVDARIDSVNKVSYDILRERLDSMTEQIKNLGNLKNEILDEAYPIGMTVFLQSSIDPNKTWPGVWVKTMKGKVPVGLDESDKDFNTVGKTGGSKTGSFGLDKNGYAQLTISMSESTIFYNRRESAAITTNIKAAAGSAATELHKSHTSAVALGGKTNEGNIIQPYQVGYWWQRIA